MKIKILFVCLGNICRSPAAEAIFRSYVEQIGRTQDFEIDSAGLLDHHEGELPDSRMRAHGAKRNYRINSPSRLIQYEDFFSFDHIIGMDASNICQLREKAPTADTMVKISLISDFLPRPLAWDHVPDPYYGGEDGFEQVLNMLEEAAPAIIHCLDEKTDV